jgi:hypothetical protein
MTDFNVKTMGKFFKMLCCAKELNIFSNFTESVPLTFSELGGKREE